MTMQEVLKQNKIKMESERIARLKRERTSRIKHNILSGVIISVLLVTTVIVSNKLDRKAINECTQDHDINYCIAGLS